MSWLVFLHVLVAMLLVGGLIASAVTSRFELWNVARWSAAVAVGATIVTIGLGEGLAGDEDVDAGWLDASRGLAVFGLLLGGCVLAIAASLARTRPGAQRVTPPLAVLLVLIGLATAFVMAAKPS
jgi:ABC-type Na+ efflux pump permease subunit